MWWLPVLCTSIVYAQDNPWVVETIYGRIRGRWSAERDVWEFIGIPYAQPPTGDNRFKGPLPPTSWTGIRDSSINTIICSQYERTPERNLIGSEDCLIINVFAPESAKANGHPLPVLFYIHGGGFTTGHSDRHNPKFTTRHDVILVTINYRLGSLAFMCLGTEGIPGNAGLKDQLAALKWTRDNIARFGGNPNAVTIYGDNAGAISAEALVLTRASYGLIHGAIIESGSALTMSTLSYKRLGLAKATALQLNFETVDNLTLLGNFYKSSSVQDVLSANSNAFCIERELENIDAAITKSFKEILDQKDYIDIPVIFAYSDMEGLTFGGEFNDDVIFTLQNNFDRFLPFDLYFSSPADKTAVADSVRSLYFGNGPITAESAKGYVDLLTDSLFVSSMYRSAVHHVNNSNNKIYIMEFAYRGGFNLPNENYPQLIGAGHSDILAHVMDFGYSNPDTLEQDQIVRDRMTLMWTNFVRTGNPTPPTARLPVEWTPFDLTNQSYLWMGADMELRKSPLENRMKLWNDIYEKYYVFPPRFDGNGALTHKVSIIVLCLCYVMLCCLPNNIFTI